MYTSISVCILTLLMDCAQVNDFDALHVILDLNNNSMSSDCTKQELMKYKH